MCKCKREFVDNLLFCYVVAHELSSFVIAKFGVHWVMPRRISNVLVGWSGEGIGLLSTGVPLEI